MKLTCAEGSADLISHSAVSPRMVYWRCRQEGNVRRHCPNFLLEKLLTLPWNREAVMCNLGPEVLGAGKSEVPSAGREAKGP